MIRLNSFALKFFLNCIACGWVFFFDSYKARSEESTKSPSELRLPKTLVDGDDLDIQDQLAKRLLSCVATLRVEVDVPKDMLTEESTRFGFALPITPTRLAVHAFVVDRAKKIEVRGKSPENKWYPAQLVYFDRESRVAHLEIRTSLEKLGLSIPSKHQKKSWRINEPVVALASTLSMTALLYGRLVSIGDAPEDFGYGRTDLKLSSGMPVFNMQGAVLGIPRRVAWDIDPFLLIPIDTLIETQAPKSLSQNLEKIDAAEETLRAEDEVW